jgi:hypothetical protein
MRKLVLVLAALALIAVPAAARPVSSTTTVTAPKVDLGEFTLPPAAMAKLRSDFYDQILARNKPGTWAPMKMQLSNKHLAMMGLPSARTLRRMDFSTPTVFHRNGTTSQIDPALISYAGLGSFGIRPGAWLLLINDQGIGWCSAAHVYGSPGSYDISTAGHCGKTGDIATVIGVVGNNTPVLIDFGKFATSHDGGVGNDWALIDIYPQYQHLVTPTMAFWGGPRGMYTKTGSVATLTFAKNNLLAPRLATNPDPLLAQGLLHYGHGTGVGAGGTPRVASSIVWAASYYMFFGAITPGDSGSGSNTLGGDTVGAANEAAGINTHLYVDPLMRKGLGIMAGTRATLVSGALANGQLVGYPAPVPILP